MKIDVRSGDLVDSKLGEQGEPVHIGLETAMARALAQSGDFY